MNTLLDMADFCRTSAGAIPDALADTLVDELMLPTVADADKAEFLRALNIRGEKPEEVASFARALRYLMEDAGLEGTFGGKALLDCCGTGGGGLSIVNVSTAAVFVLAACGVPVVKHGNRAVTKKSGSADVLEALGLRIEMNPAQARDCLAEVGATFYFARTYHPAFGKVAAVRQQLGAEGRKTIFNLLGPVLNPALPATQLIGVFDPKHVAFYDHILHDLDVDGRAVVHGIDEITGRPLGELSTLGPNTIRGARPDGSPLGEWEVPSSEGTLEELLVDSAEESALRISAILSGEERGAARDLVLANAAAGLVVQGTAAAFTEALDAATEAVDNGKALGRLEAWRAFSGKLATA